MVVFVCSLTVSQATLINDQIFTQTAQPVTQAPALPAKGQDNDFDDFAPYNSSRHDEFDWKLIRVYVLQLEYHDNFNHRKTPTFPLGNSHQQINGNGERDYIAVFRQIGHVAVGRSCRPRYEHATRVGCGAAGIGSGKAAARILYTHFGVVAGECVGQ